MSKSDDRTIRKDGLYVQPHESPWSRQQSMGSLLFVIPTFSTPGFHRHSGRIRLLGWPTETELLKRFYPTSTLVTSRDIITLWVARMVILGIFNTGEIPFHHVSIHPKILDRYGETMSKSKGNGVDPLDVISLLGADALRFGMAIHGN